MSNLSEEEKQAIERIKEDLKEAEKLNYMYADISIYDLYDVLNLIEKQQKETKELKAENLHWKGQYYLISRKIKEIQILDKKGIGFNYNSNQVLGLLQELLGDDNK